MRDLVGSSTPPNYLADEKKYQRLKTPLEKAQYDAEIHGCKIEGSRILNAGLGLFASEAKKEGDTFGHHWGKIYFLDQVPVKNSERYLMTTKYLPAKEDDVDGERRFMHIDGVRACAAGYVNDPALVGYKANAAFQELDLLPGHFGN
jgi:hypothetical protein